MTPVDNPSAIQGSSTPIVVRLLSQKGAVDMDLTASHLPGGTLDQGDVVFTDSETADADVAVIINYLKYDQKIRARKGYVWKWDNEPIVRRPFAKGLDRVYTHAAAEGDHRVVTAPPILDWWVGRSYDQLSRSRAPRKTREISAIASTKTMIEGHRKRTEFVGWLVEQLPELDLYGQGRDRELADKWDGLAPYRYSIAIENTSKPDYWTEKISDCFLANTVPLYYGATNIGDYFPEGSFVWLPADDRERALAVIRETLKTDHWDARREALRVARKRVLESYSLGAQIMGRVRAERDVILSSPHTTVRVHGRRTRPGGWVRGAGMVGNIRHQLAKRSGRR